MMQDKAKLRRAMVDGQVRTFDVTDRGVIEAMYDVPRDQFVSSEMSGLAYSEAAMVAPGSERTLLKPMVLGRMLQSLQIVEGEHVLNVAGGSGYAAAILAALGAKVTLLEADSALAAVAGETLGRLGVSGVSIVNAPLEHGAKASAPFDAILIEGVIEEGLEELLAQLRPNGRLLTLVGSAREAVKVVLYRRAGDSFGSRRICDGSGPWLKSFARPHEFVL
jgi:protein-L-isoaspartate(D-aspartate) O-methyltransferase